MLFCYSSIKANATSIIWVNLVYPPGYPDLLQGKHEITYDFFFTYPDMITHLFALRAPQNYQFQRLCSFCYDSIILSIFLLTAPECSNWPAMLIQPNATSNLIIVACVSFGCLLMATKKTADDASVRETGINNLICEQVMPHRFHQQWWLIAVRTSTRMALYFMYFNKVNILFSLL